MKNVICLFLIWGVCGNFVIFGMGYILYFTLVGGQYAQWFPLLVLVWCLSSGPMMSLADWLDGVRQT